MTSTSHEPVVPITKAFTLIEPLVVIAIVGILAALLLPVLSTAKARAQQMVCMNNLRQINLGVHLYLDDQNNGLPGNTNAAHSPFVSWTAYRKLINNDVGVKGASSPQDKVFACPADILKDGAVHNCVDTYVGGGMGVAGRATRGSLIIQGGGYLGRTLILGTGWGAQSFLGVEGSGASAIHILQYFYVTAYAGSDGSPGMATLSFTIDEHA